ATPGESTSPCCTPPPNNESPCCTPPPESASPCCTPTPPPPPQGTPYDIDTGAPLYGCEQVGRSEIPLALEKTTAPPSGATVLPGQEIGVEIGWRPGDWTSAWLHKVIDCVFVNGRFAPELTGGEKPTVNDGH